MTSRRRCSRSWTSTSADVTTDACTDARRDQPERFVTFLAYEWGWNSDPDADHGHRNVFSLYDDLPLVCSSWQGSNTPPALFQVLRRLARTGTTRILRQCREHGLPEPEFLAEAQVFKVHFLKDPYTPERLAALGLNERQVRAMQHVKERGSITNREYQALTGVRSRTASLDLNDLATRGILQRVGTTGRATRYVAEKARNPQ